MTNQIVAFAQAQAKTAVLRVAVPTAFALAGGLFLLFAIVGLFFALFFWLAPEHGPAAASLIVAAVALGLGVICFDQRGHGESGGEMARGCCRTWLRSRGACAMRSATRRRRWPSAARAWAAT